MAKQAKQAKQAKHTLLGRDPRTVQLFIAFADILRQIQL
jgi:hypothetical protein